ncbi:MULTISPECIES: SDR family NAD(P)-dependent oxidoreductase [unclassified Caballeronia]|uniref:SDR family NAD(P)-dependent oxidoreductase n=1 Tax=unclassified Caballeronia TaxID=2646786 RepID=UPI0028567871|nr:MULTISPECIES: SDR family NAD(P)-dependent oxidoreductase [unclassified Caballeronia]MDR5777166.1 SDR family oxidoreductase [Caballeronia sp. LZ002]MDR5852609.1 SDR family oxidoreductase [Caballeronia sp. LZ003]
MLQGKVVIISGAGAGIGRDFARAFAAHGANVVVNDIERPDGTSAAHAVVEDITASGGRAIAAPASVADRQAADGIVAVAMDRFGRVDCVVNNAGIVRDRLIFNMTDEEWRDVIDVHLNGSFNLTRASAPYMKAQGSGSYIFMTSTSGLIGNVGQANYSAAKMALVGLSKSVALDMARYHIRSNCIAPWAWTSMMASIPAETPEQQARVAKLKTMESAKIAPLAVYLASDRSAHVSGQIFGVRANELYLFNQIRMIRSIHRDGGWTPESIADTAIPALESSFFENVPASQLTPWDPV